MRYACMKYEGCRDKDLQWHIEMMVRILKIVKESDRHFVRLRFIATPSKNSNVVL